MAIKYKYNIQSDVEHSIWVKNNLHVFPKDITVLKPDIDRMLDLYEKQPNGPEILTDLEIECWWVSSGCGGMYDHESQRIYVCPWAKGKYTLKEVIEHELKHLGHPEADEMSHEEKEKYIEKTNESR